MMTMTYPFPISGDEFKGKRVLVTGGTKGITADIRRSPMTTGRRRSTSTCWHQFVLIGHSCPA